MGKIALITDTHFGIRNDSIAFLDYFKKFYDNIFFPYIEKNDIKTIIHLGDLVDRRKYISYYTASRLWKDFVEKISKYDFYLILGNHDVFYTNTNDLNGPFELFKNSFPIYKNPQEINIEGENFLFIPWINKENREKTYDLVKHTKASSILGHLELKGFEFHKGILANSGDDSSAFSRFNMVCSGHYHRKSSRGNIHYLGSPCEFTWADYDDPKGFHIYDTETKELNFIQNPYIMFNKIFYDDKNKRLAEVMDVDFKSFSESVVKVIIKNKDNSFWFDKFITELEKHDLVNLQIVEDHGNINEEIDEDIISDAESTLDILNKHISQTSFEPKFKSELNSFMIKLYHEAHSLENF